MLLSSRRSSLWIEDMYLILVEGSGFWMNRISRSSDLSLIILHANPN